MYNIAQVKQHVWRAFRSANKVQARSNNLSYFSPSCEAPFDGQLVEIERRVKTPLIEPQLTSHFVYEFFAVLQCDLSRFPHAVLKAIYGYAACVYGTKAQSLMK